MKNSAVSKRMKDFSNVLRNQFQIESPQILNTSTICKSTLMMARIRYEKSHFGRIKASAVGNGFLLGVELKGEHQQRVYNGRSSRCLSFGQDAVNIRKLSEDYSAYLCSPFDFLSFYVPQSALHAVADDVGARRINSLDCAPGLKDPVIGGLGRALLPALNCPDQFNMLFFDHMALAFNMHIAQVYGGMRIPTSGKRIGVLAPWQEKRAKEILATNGKGDISLASIAEECGLSRSYFIKAFRQTTGLTPHRWHLDHRIGAARDLLLNHLLPIEEVAVICGFSDQAHLTRVFTSIVGLPPATWRRQNYGYRRGAL